MRPESWVCSRAPDLSGRQSSGLLRPSNLSGAPRVGLKVVLDWGTLIEDTSVWTPGCALRLRAQHGAVDDAICRLLSRVSATREISRVA
jgi:hypothetical protein